MTTTHSTRHPHRRLTATARWLRGDRGSGTGWAIGITIVGLLSVFLTFDTATAIENKATIVDVAQQAARRGADQLDLAVLRSSGQVQLDPAAAQAAAEQWLTQAGHTGTVAATTAQVTVQVSITQPAMLLAAVGVDDYTLTAQATAEPVQPATTGPAG
jgi:hypothetical protein